MDNSHPQLPVPWFEQPTIRKGVNDRFLTMLAGALLPLVFLFPRIALLKRSDRWALPLLVLSVAICCLVCFVSWEWLSARLFSRLFALVSGPLSSRLRETALRMLSVCIWASGVALLLWLAYRGAFGKVVLDEHRFGSAVLVESMSLWLAGVGLFEIAYHVKRTIALYFGNAQESGGAFSQSGTSLRPRHGSAHIVHLTDLHLTRDEQTQTMELRPSPNRMFASVARSGVLDTVNCVLITGDITDTGHRDEWQAFFSAVQDSASLPKCVILPGNHDYNLEPPEAMVEATGNANNVRRLLEWVRYRPTQDETLRKLRMLRFALAANVVQGERAWVLGRDDQPMLLSVLMNSYATDIQRFVESPPASCMVAADIKYPVPIVGRDEPALLRMPNALWESMFPMVVEVPGSELVVAILDTVGKSSHVVTNAFGRVARNQMRKLPRLVRHFRGRPVIAAMHHHLAVPTHRSVGKGEGKRAHGGIRRILEWLTSGSLSLVNGRDVAVLLSELRIGLVFNGHQHAECVAYVDERVQTVSGPSITAPFAHPKTHIVTWGADYNARLAPYSDTCSGLLDG